MFRCFSIGVKLLIFAGLCVALISGVCVSVFRTQHEMTDAIDRESLAVRSQDLDHAVQGIYSMCGAQHQSLEQLVDVTMNVARSQLQMAGGFQVDPKETVTWKAVNQFTHQTEQVNLPRVKFGQRALESNTDLHSRSPVVDDVMHLTGETCTIFQRMNEAGDMLRVCTNVETKEGKRAIGTFIPRINPDGAANPVLAKVLKGETYRGRAFVVKAWFITAYEPIKDKEGKVAGILYVGVPQDNVPGLRQGILNSTHGDSGYAFVLDSKGNYVVSRNGAMDGVNVYDRKDVDGRPVIQELCQKAASLQPGEIAEYRHLWQEQADANPQKRIVRFIYFKDWDWIVGMSIAEDEMLSTQKQMNELSNRNKWFVGLSALAAILATVVAALVLARSITRPLNRTKSVLESVALGDLTKKVEVSTLR